MVRSRLFRLITQTDGMQYTKLCYFFSGEPSFSTSPRKITPGIWYGIRILCVYHLGLCVFFPGVFLSSRVTGACPVTTDLIMRVNVRTTNNTAHPRRTLATPLESRVCVLSAVVVLCRYTTAQAAGRWWCVPGQPGRCSEISDWSCVGQMIGAFLANKAESQKVPQFLSKATFAEALFFQGWCSVVKPSLFLPPRLTVPVFRRLPAYYRVTVYRQGHYRREMKYRLPSRNYRHIYYRQTELPSDLCLTVYRQINTSSRFPT